MSAEANIEGVRIPPGVVHIIEGHVDLVAALAACRPSGFIRFADEQPPPARLAIRPDDDPPEPHIVEG